MKKKSRAANRASVRDRIWQGLWLAVLCAALAIAMFWERPASIQLPPAPTHYLEDRAGLVSPEFAAAKNQYLEYLSRTARIAQINVVILPRAPASELEEFTIRAASAWKTGTAGVDNGLVLFVFAEDRKLRLEVGYGLEWVLTDVEANQLLAQVVVPAFARGQYETGIEEFLSAVNKLLESSEVASRRASPVVQLLAAARTGLRQSSRVARDAWGIFVEGDVTTRCGIALFGSIIVGLALYALSYVAGGIPPLIMLPWRAYRSPTLRGLKLSGIGAQLALGNSQRPPPIVVDLLEELQLAPIVVAFIMAAALVVGAALISTGAGVFMDGTGRFSGAGATVPWPGR